MNTSSSTDLSLACFHPTLQRWFLDAFEKPTAAQTLAWPAIAAKQNTLLLAPTGSGKTLAAFLVAINRLMFEMVPEVAMAADVASQELSSRHKAASRQGTTGVAGVRTLYISPLQALGVGAFGGDA